MKIGVDIDEICVEFAKGYLMKYNEKYGRISSFENLFSYNLWEPLELTKQEAVDLADEFYESDYFQNIQILDGAKESLTELAKDNEITFITSRPIKLKGKTESFIKSNFPEFSFKLIFSNDFFSQGNLSKAEICLEEGISLLIEDNKDYSVSCADKGVKVILFDKPWNKGFEYENITRVKGWKEALEVLSLYAN